MARITIHCIAKNSSAVLTDSVEVTSKEETKQQLDEIAATATEAFSRWYWEAEAEEGELTPAEIAMLAELDIEIL